MDLWTNIKINKEYVDHAVIMHSKWKLLEDSPTLKRFKLVHEKVMKMVESLNHEACVSANPLISPVKLLLIKYRTDNQFLISNL